MTRTKRKAVIAVLMILAVALYFVSGTYARYADEFSGTATVQAAYWNINLTNENGTEIEDTFELTFTVDENENVVDGKIAPETTATAELYINLAETEVAVDIEADIDESSDTYKDLIEQLGESADDITFKATIETEQEDSSVTANEDGSTTVALPNGGAFTDENGKYTVKITLEWQNNDEHNLSDTTVGEEQLTLTIPVKVTVKQHIGTDDHTGN